MRSGMGSLLIEWTIIFSLGFCLSGVVAQAGERPKVDPQISELLSETGDSVAVWVFLNPEGFPEVHSRRGTNSSLWLSPRAVDRHRKKNLPVVMENDRPISLEVIDHLRAAGLRVRTVSRWFTAVTGWIDQSSLKRIDQLPWVDSVRVVRSYRRPIDSVSTTKTVLPRETTPRGDHLDYGPSFTQIAQLGVDQLHQDGYDGSGVVIGILDTGFNPEVEVFDSTTVIATRDFINGDDDVADNNPTQMDHGTKVWSVCGGYLPGELIGPAYGAEFLLAKTEIVREEIQIEEDFYVAALEWFDSSGADIVSSSLGYPDFYTYDDLNGNTAITTQAVDIAASRGVLVVTAAGNEGSSQFRPWIMPPADAHHAIAVGGVLSSGVRWGSSSVGPTADGRIKPDVMAMSSQVWVADDAPATYRASSGTSFATPLVAGACALLLQKDPSLLPAQVISALHESSTNAADPNNEMGYGIVDLPAAMELIAPTPKVIAYPNPFSDSVTFVLPGQITPAETVRIAVYTISGKKVFTDEFDYRPYRWTALGDGGEKLADGIYFCSFQAGGAKYTVRVVYQAPVDSGPEAGLVIGGAGDFDGDGLIGASDILLLLDYLYPRQSPSSGSVLPDSDLNGDQRTDLIDAVVLVNYCYAGESGIPTSRDQ